MAMGIALLMLMPMLMPMLLAYAPAVSHAQAGTGGTTGGSSTTGAGSTTGRNTGSVTTGQPPPSPGSPCQSTYAASVAAGAQVFSGLTQPSVGDVALTENITRAFIPTPGYLAGVGVALAAGEAAVSFDIDVPVPQERFFINGTESFRNVNLTARNLTADDLFDPDAWWRVAVSLLVTKHSSAPACALDLDRVLVADESAWPGWPDPLQFGVTLTLRIRAPGAAALPLTTCVAGRLGKIPVVAQSFPVADFTSETPRYPPESSYLLSRGIASAQLLPPVANWTRFDTYSPTIGVYGNGLCVINKTIMVTEPDGEMSGNTVPGHGYRLDLVQPVRMLSITLPDQIYSFRAQLFSGGTPGAVYEKGKDRRAQSYQADQYGRATIQYMDEDGRFLMLFECSGSSFDRIEISTETEINSGWCIDEISMSTQVVAGLQPPVFFYNSTGSITGITSLSGSSGTSAPPPRPAGAPPTLGGGPADDGGVVAAVVIVVIVAIALALAVGFFVYRKRKQAVIDDGHGSIPLRDFTAKEQSGDSSRTTLTTAEMEYGGIRSEVPSEYTELSSKNSPASPYGESTGGSPEYGDMPLPQSSGSYGEMPSPSPLSPASRAGPAEYGEMPAPQGQGSMEYEAMPDT